jgi:hypothetical protein
MATWTWMRYSYVWEMTPYELWQGKQGTGFPPGDECEWRQAHTDFYRTNVQRYVRVSGFYGGDSYSNFKYLEDADGYRIGFYFPPLHGVARGTPITVTGRICMTYRSEPQVGGVLGRLCGASIAGLVVGAMGVAVFGLYLQRWLKEREPA